MILNLNNADVENKNEWEFIFDVEKYNDNNRVGYYINVIKNDDPLFAFNFVKTLLDEYYIENMVNLSKDSKEDYNHLIQYIEDMNTWLSKHSMNLINRSEEYNYTVLVNYVVNGNIGFDYFHYKDLPNFKEFKKGYLF